MPQAERQTHTPSHPALTANQNKVIRDKYLRDAPSVDVWLKGVAHNVALAEILHDRSDRRPDLKTLLEDVDFHVEPRSASSARGDYKPLEGDMLLLHRPETCASERERNFRRFMERLEAWAALSAAVPTWQATFFDLMRSFTFLPNSPTLMNAGRELQQLAACYVLPVGDSIEEIFEAVKNQALIHKSGGGTGFSFGRLRPARDCVKSTQGLASGPLSFMKIFDAATEQVKQGGTRRGANMAILPCNHPDILDFIAAKANKGALENFNLSVGITDAFIKAAREDREIDLINPHTGEVARKESAKRIWEAMCRQAWQTGDPGYVVLDRINESGSNTTPHVGTIEATNPCGEQPLLPNEPCNLGSINLAKFARPGRLKGPRSPEELGWNAAPEVLAENLRPVASVILWNDLAQTVRMAVRFLDNVIDVNHYPTAEIERMAKGSRRIGLGIMGLAEFLVLLGVPYDCPAAVAITEGVMQFITTEALTASQILAQERGRFPNWEGSTYDPQSPHYRGIADRPRHCARTTIAPTGTIAIAAGLQGSGIEPFFAIAYTRYNAKGLDTIRRGETPAAEDTFHEVNPLFRGLAGENNFFGMAENELWDTISKNKGSLAGIEAIPEEVRRLFRASHDISVEWHVRMQAAAQKYTDNAVSKTINLAHDATVEDVSHAFELAYELGCKGLTVYRDGSKEDQVLNLTNPRPSPGANGVAEPGGAESHESIHAVPTRSIPDGMALHGTETSTVRENGRPTGLRTHRVVDDPSVHRGTTSVYYEKPTGYGPLHVTIIYDADGPYRVFASIPPMGTEISGLTSVMGILLSKYLETGGDPARILKHLNSIKGDRPHGFGAARVDSIPHALAECLKDHLIQTGKMNNGHAKPENGHPQASGSDALTGGSATVQESSKPFAGPLYADPGRADDFCPSCFSRNVYRVSGCKEPTCADCGFSNCG